MTAIYVVYATAHGETEMAAVFDNERAALMYVAMLEEGGEYSGEKLELVTVAHPVYSRPEEAINDTIRSAFSQF